ncbi:hypothetical protein FJ950_27480 [Mesorhizobium sp. B2-3-14]|uniref:hypothetical protein n=1 Tax=Mesorhizobium sp. B2-3-14 TaxID=2589950 RepID=UPI001129ADAA|nr:hypothetical protein [Mesorhizobium sp. B2-3-14]TPL79945.1 hypothetical protein FJ950_27480 [Mesorhizobium sp. B2-3-14]
MKVSTLRQINLEEEFRDLKNNGLPQRTELCDLMSSFGSDKSGPFHNYTLAYDWLFSNYREENLNLFELGLGTNKVGAPSSMGPDGKPGASLRGWRAYFPHASIYGADIDSNILFDEQQIRTFWTDQRDPQAVRALWDEVGDLEFDIIIDDGLHEASANICFFMESFRKLKQGGIYIIEDIPPIDADLMRSFVLCISCVSQSIVYENLEHPRNNVDNRLVIFQRA